MIILLLFSLVHSELITSNETYTAVRHEYYSNDFDPISEGIILLNDSFNNCSKLRHIKNPKAVIFCSKETVYPGVTMTLVYKSCRDFTFTFVLASMKCDDMKTISNQTNMTLINQHSVFAFPHVWIGHVILLTQAVLIVIFYFIKIYKFKFKINIALGLLILLYFNAIIRLIFSIFGPYWINDNLYAKDQIWFMVILWDLSAWELWLIQFYWFDITSGGIQKVSGCLTVYKWHYTILVTTILCVELSSSFIIGFMDPKFIYPVAVVKLIFHILSTSGLILTAFTMIRLKPIIVKIVLLFLTLLGFLIYFSRMVNLATTGTNGNMPPQFQYISLFLIQFMFGNLDILIIFKIKKD